MAPTKVWSMSPWARGVCSILGGALFVAGYIAGLATVRDAHAHDPKPAAAAAAPAAPGPAIAGLVATAPCLPERYPDGMRYCVQVTLDDPDHPGPDAKWTVERYRLTLGELCRVIPDIACPGEPSSPGVAQGR